jgi:hypothetical protein
VGTRSGNDAVQLYVHESALAQRQLIGRPAPLALAKTTRLAVNIEHNTITIADTGMVVPDNTMTYTVNETAAG